MESQRYDKLDARLPHFPKLPFRDTFLKRQQMLDRNAIRLVSHPPPAILSAELNKLPPEGEGVMFWL